MKLSLDNKDLTDGFFEETRLLGIMAPIKDYMFCWQVNQRQSEQSGTVVSDAPRQERGSEPSPNGGSRIDNSSDVDCHLVWRGHGCMRYSPDILRRMM